MNEGGIVAIVQARTSSTRLLGKVLAPILGRAMILRQIDRVRRAHSPGRLVVATSIDSSDDALASLMVEAGLDVHRGSRDDVLSRFTGAMDAFAPDAAHIVRLTGDCPLADPEMIDAVVRHHLETGADFTSNTLVPSFPDGLDVEVVRAEVLRTASREARLASEREHVLPFVWSRPERFKLSLVRSPVDHSHLRWTVDTPGDLALVTAVFEALHATDPDFSTDAILDLFAKKPDLALLNAGEGRNEGYLTSLREDVPLPRASFAELISAKIRN